MASVARGTGVSPVNEPESQARRLRHIQFLVMLLPYGSLAQKAGPRADTVRPYTCQG